MAIYQVAKSMMHQFWVWIGLGTETGDHVRQFGLGIMRSTSCTAVSQTIIFAVLILLTDGIEIVEGCIGCFFNGVGNIAEVPIGPNKTHCEPSNGTANEGVYNSR